MADREQRSAGEHLGANVRQRREALGLSQNDVAAAMAAAGHRWHQVTVYRVESGTRTVEVHEGYTLAAVLGVDLRALVADPGEAHRIYALTDGQLATTTAYTGAAEAVEALVRARDALAAAVVEHALPDEVTVESATSTADGLRVAVVGGARAILEDFTVSAAVKEGTRAAAAPRRRAATPGDGGQG